MNTLLALSGVHKRYGNGTLAVENLSLRIGEGEFVSFLGPSGCGKSTLLKMIAGLSELSAGSINWPQDMQTRSLGDRSANMGFVFQEPTLMPWANVFDNVWLPLRLQGRSKASCQNEVTAMLATVGLGQFAHVYPRELSGGMKMRVSIARALITKPQLLLMDEPFAALDEMTRFKLNNELLALWQTHRFTAIFVTHSVYESVYLSQRVVVMASRPGRVLDELSIAEAYPRTEAFRATAQYNAWCVRVSQMLGQAGAHGG